MAGLLLVLGLSAPARAEERPPAPPDLQRYEAGDPTDRRVKPTGPALLLGGGGRDVDAACRRWLAHAAGGDVVVLRASGSDGYNPYFFAELGGCDGVETLLVTTRELAASPYVVHRLERAEAIFLAGGDQSRYLRAWRDTPLAAALQEAWARGVALGGTSAGCAVLGSWLFTAHRGTIRSREALADPFHERVQLAPAFLDLAPLTGVITDTHFGRRERLGRLAVFLARIARAEPRARPVGLGIDEGTALLVEPEGAATVYGRRGVTVLSLASGPERCAPGEPLSGLNLRRRVLRAGDTLRLPLTDAEPPGNELSVREGRLFE